MAADMNRGRGYNAAVHDVVMVAARTTVTETLAIEYG